MPPSLESNQSILETIHKLLGSTLFVTMTDGRTAKGKFLSIDRLGNILLQDVVERREITYCPKVNGEIGMRKWDTKRVLSQAVILGERVAKVQIKKHEYQSRVGRPHESE